MRIMCERVGIYRRNNNNILANNRAIYHDRECIAAVATEEEVGVVRVLEQSVVYEGGPPPVSQSCGQPENARHARGHGRFVTVAISSGSCSDQ